MVLYGPWTAALPQGTAAPLISSLEGAMIHPHRIISLPHKLEGGTLLSGPD